MKRRLAILLTMALLLFTLPVSSLATEAEPGQDAPAAAEVGETTSAEGTDPADETAPAEETTTASGTSGENLTWTLDSAGTLTISGAGDMTDYNYDAPAPWADDRNSILSVVIESGVTSIGDYAFDGCLVLTQVSIPGTVTTIGQYAFSVCDALGQVTIPEGVTTLEAGAFSDCSVMAVSLPSTLTTIGRGAFNLAYNLTSIVIPEGVTEIPDYAFYDCYRLTSVTLPDGITRIGSHAFSYCPLTSLELPDGLTYIGDDAFWQAQMTSVTIPAGVTYLGSGAFSGCMELETVTFTGDAPTFGQYVNGEGNLEYTIFTGLTLTAYYPAGNPTWTADVMQDYGGDITWVAYEPEEDEDGHVWDEGVVTTAPTCTEEGVRTYTCLDCGKTRTEAIPAAGHTYGNTWMSDENGHWQICSVCGESSEISAHAFVWVADKIPTTTEEGLRHEECTVCGYQGASEVMPVLNPGTTDEGNGDDSQTGEETTPEEAAPADNTGDTNTAAEDTSNDSPKTGDESRVALSAAALALSMGALACIVLVGKRRRG